MKVTRITRMSAHRVFRDFTWPATLQPFGQFNLIYGWNGSGKTTFSSLFHHLQLVLPSPKATLSLRSTARKSQAAIWRMHAYRRSECSTGTSSLPPSSRLAEG